MSLFLCFTFFLLQLIIFVNANGIYSIVGPGTIRSHFKYNVVVSVHKSKGPCQIKVGISGPSYNEQKSIDVQPMSTTNVEFDVPKLKSGEYQLTAVGLSGISFENSTVLNFADYEPSIYIQTDKATYKAGDLVQYRVLFLDENTRPAHVKRPINILIKDAAKNIISQIKDIDLTKGVYTGKFQLSEQPVLGNWIVDVIIGEESIETKSFEVAKYVQPKFVVAIETVKNVAIPDNIIKVTVRSTYTFGQPVKGKANVSLTFAKEQYSGPNLISVKTINIEEDKGLVEFDLFKDFANKYWETLVSQGQGRLKMVIVMEEKLTGIIHNASAIINLHKYRFKIIGVDIPTTYHKDTPVKYKIGVTNIDGYPVHDMENPVTLQLEWGRYLYENNLVFKYESKLNGNGIVEIEFIVPEGADYYRVQCQYQDLIEYFPPLSESENYILELVVIPEKPTLRKNVTIEIKSSDLLSYFVYTIVARGNILKSEHVHVPGGHKAHTIQFTPIFEMIPDTKVYVYYVHNNNLRFQEKHISFEKNFENSLYINTTAQAKPGEDMMLKISSDPNSFVGLTAVDQSVRALKLNNDISSEDIFNNLNGFDAKTPLIEGYGRYPGEISGLVTLTNANYPWKLRMAVISGGVGGNSGGPRGPFAQLPQQPKIRMEFPETWFFENIENIDANGFILAKKVPDTITSWIITGFSVNPKTGLALSENPTTIQAFQTFFISTNLPYSVKKGEVIAVPVYIFNYMDKELDAEITMDNSGNEYDFTKAINEVVDSPLDEVKQVKQVTIPSNSGRSVSFMIRPKQIGQIVLKITAVTPLAGDAIQQLLRVEAEGVTHLENQAIFVNLKNNPEQTKKLTVNIPAKAVTDSEYIELSVVGDLIGPTIDNLIKFVRMPDDRREQAMVKFVHNVLILKYLETTNPNISTVIKRFKSFLDIAYQRELTYRNDDGSYSAFGKLDKAGSTWLTAYVMRFFHQAAKYSHIEIKILKEGLDFLVSRQTVGGNFLEHGQLIDFDHQNELGLTAFVLLAFMENVVNFPMYQKNIDKGMQYLIENVDKSDDQYSLAIAASVLRLAKNPLADKVLAKLLSIAKQDKDHKWWSKAPVPKSMDPDSILRTQSNDIEITSYVLLAMLEKEPLDNALPIIKWLISQSNNGGFASTQGTIVSLLALIKFAEMTGLGTEDIKIDFVSSGGAENKGSFRVNIENSLVLQTHVLPRTARKVDFTAKGEGSAVVQLSYRYNLAENDKNPSFEVETAVKVNEPTQELNVEVCAKFTPLKDENVKNESNMAVLEVALPSGYTAKSEDFGDIESVDQVKRVETKNANSKVIVYIDSMPVGETKCVSVKAFKTHAVAKLKPAAVKIYVKNERKRSATQFYQVGSSLCKICDGADCGTGCKT